MEKMNYEATLEYMFNSFPMYSRIGKSAYKTGLENTLTLDEYFGHQHQKYKTIHVAGTNGKGSVSHFLASVLQSAGYRVGLYTSPHLVDFRERIRVDGCMVTRKFVMDFVHHNRDFFAQVQPSFFEMTVMMAFEFFAQKKVDVAVIEVGLGGRLDSTNIISPDVSVITNISFDHQGMLGDTLAKIATEKAGIIKSGVPVVIGEAEGEVYDVFLSNAKEMGAPIFLASQEHQVMMKTTQRKGRWMEEKDYPWLAVGLDGEYQQKNVATVLTAIDVLRQEGYEITERQVRAGLRDVCKKTGLQGRWQTVKREPHVVCDIGHNVGGIAYTVEQMRQQNKPLRIVFGMVNDKDIRGVLNLLPKEATYYFTRASIPRALDEKQLFALAQECGLKGTMYDNVKDAVWQALRDADKNDFVYVGGSNFVVADALKDCGFLFKG